MKTNYPEILNEEQYNEKMQIFEQELEDKREIVYIESFDNKKLYCECYLQKNATKNIIILHGFTEFSPKYRETVAYFLKLNFNVFVYDQRGHGLSYREAEDLTLIHVNSFNSYVKDLECIIEKLVKVKRKDLPIHLFSHSMGGAVALLYMMKHSENIEKAVLSSPMISPKTKNVPRLPVMCMVGLHGLFLGWKRPFVFAGKFDPDVKISDTLDTSYSRFTATMKIRKSRKEYQSAGATNKWMWDALAVQTKIMRKKQLNKIKSKVLIISAENETVVKNEFHSKISKLIKNSTLVTVPCAKHNIFFSSGETLKDYYSIVFDFLS